ncbi:MAG: hypothetical protein ABI671_03835 [Burkholderiales bacterium]
MDPTIRLRLATRIHFALRRNYGEDVEVSTLLRGLPEAREALWVCAASGDAELTALAQQFTDVTAAAALAAAKAAQAQVAAPQDTVWAQDTSGFGLTRPPTLADEGAAVTAPPGWRQRMNWLRSQF